MRKMTYGITYEQGSIVLIQFPFTDYSSQKKRPALVISPDWFNETYKDVILCAITSSIPTDFNAQKDIIAEILSEDLESGELHQRSIIKLARIFTVEQTKILKRVGKLKKEKISEVLVKLKAFFSESGTQIVGTTK